MNITYWKKTDINNNLLGILVKQDKIYKCCVEINETYTDKFVLQQISYDEFVDTTRHYNCLILPEDNFIFPSFSTSSL